MLIHKATMGVLDGIWEGAHALEADGSLIPVERQAVLSDVDDPEEWWEIANTGTLSRKVRCYYPFMQPVVDSEDKLVDVVPLRSEEDQEAIQQAAEVKKAKRQEAAQRGYQRANRIRPVGLMPFLQCTPACNNAGNARQG